MVSCRALTDRNLASGRATTVRDVSTETAMVRLRPTLARIGDTLHDGNGAYVDDVGDVARWRVETARLS